MSNKADPGGFGTYVPGFDFLQKLAQGGQAPLAGWVAPTLDAEALDKRIQELKAVQFWLDQNAAALKATLQALEVQKMTLATLKTMNVPLSGAGLAWPMPGTTPPSPQAGPAAAPQAPASGAPAADPLQYWGALTRQFQQIAADAMKDVSTRAAAAQAAASPAAKKAAAPKKSAARSRKTS